MLNGRKLLLSLLIALFLPIDLEFMGHLLNNKTWALPLPIGLHLLLSIYFFINRPVVLGGLPPEVVERNYLMSFQAISLRYLLFVLVVYILLTIIKLVKNRSK